MAVEVQLQSPSAGTFEQRIRPGMCIGRCVRITDAPAGQYGPNMYWWWEAWYTGDGGPKDMIAGAYDVDEHGKTIVYQIRDMTSTKFGKGKSADKTAKARARVEALLKREIDDEEPLDGLLDGCINKSAMLYLVLSDAGYLNVKFVEPYKAGSLAPMPPPEDEGEEADGPSFNSGAPMTDSNDPDDLPF